MINRTSNISRQAELLGFSRGMVYYEPKPISNASLALMHAKHQHIKTTLIINYT
jgi:hypothetical protein